MRPSEVATHLDEIGFCVFDRDNDTAEWARAALKRARDLVRDEALSDNWLRCEGTWFAGVDVLPNAPDGSVDGVPLKGGALTALDALGLSPASWHAGQVSVTYPGYPRPKEGESAGAARYRMQKDAAHVDGLVPVGRGCRIMQEPHSFILGIPLTDSAPDASPLVVWQGSHRIMGPALAEARADAAGVSTLDLDLTDAYKSARRVAFETCPRVPLPARPGQAILLHRHLLHGIAPWTAGPDPDGRAVAYFRPQLKEAELWFSQDAVVVDPT